MRGSSKTRPDTIIEWQVLQEKDGQQGQVAECSCSSGVSSGEEFLSEQEPSWAQECSLESEPLSEQECSSEQASSSVQSFSSEEQSDPAAQASSFKQQTSAALQGMQGSTSM